MITTVTREQFFTAAAQLSGMDLVYQNVSADTNYPDRIEFMSAKYVKLGDPLYVQAQLALNYTSQEMLFLFDLAVRQEVIPATVIRSRNGLPVLDRAGDRIEIR